MSDLALVTFDLGASLGRLLAVNSTIAVWVVVFKPSGGESATCEDLGGDESRGFVLRAFCESVWRVESLLSPPSESWPFGV